MLEKESSRVNKNMKIGIIHTAFIGDIILSGLLVEALYRSGHEIIFFTKAKTSLIFQNDKRVSKVVVLNKPKGIRKLFAFKSMVKQIREENLDILLCPHRSFTTTLLAFFSHVKLTIGFKNASCAFMYKIRAPYPPYEHECVRYLNLLSPEIFPKTIVEDAQKIGRPLLQYDFSVLNLEDKIQDPYFVVSIGSAWNTKKYTKEYFTEICLNILAKNSNITCYLTGDKSESMDCQAFGNTLSKYADRVVNVAGSSSLFDFAYLIEKAKFIISNDSSPVHFSSAFNTPIIAFWGPTDFKMGFYPLAESRLIISHEHIFGVNLPCQPCGSHGAQMCPKKHHLCMKKLTPNLVIPKIEKFLNSQIGTM